MTNVVFRKMLIEALKAHPHAALIGDVIFDFCKDQYRYDLTLDNTYIGKLLLDALAGIDNRLLPQIGSVHGYTRVSWSSAIREWDIKRMLDEGLCVSDGKDNPQEYTFRCEITELNHYTHNYIGKVTMTVIKLDGTREIVTDTPERKELKPWVR